MSQYSSRLALFGGTFNPVHNGHLSLAQAVAQQFSLDSVAFVPCYQPVHRENPNTSVAQRKTLIELAIQPYPKLQLDSCEIDWAEPSYTYDTLRQKKKAQPHQVLYWIMGADSFNSLMSWKNPLGILDLAHLIVCSRPDSAIDPSIFPHHHLKHADELLDQTAGKICFYEELSNPCSSSKIRSQFSATDSKDTNILKRCLPVPVLNFIQQHKLYE